jgi:predicted ATP-dependent serine protease
MAKQPLKKKASDFSSIRKKFSSSEKYKEQRYFDLGEAFQKATGLPGPAMGQINMLLGHSDTGKTTALLQTAVDAQKKNILPVLNTLNKWV